MIDPFGQPLFTVAKVVSNDMETIGFRIKIAREANGWNQPELANRAGITKQAVSQIESGATKNPRPETLLNIADITGFEYRWLITGKGHRTKEEAAKDMLDLSDLPEHSKAAIRAVMDSLSQQISKQNHIH